MDNDKEKYKTKKIFQPKDESLVESIREVQKLSKDFADEIKALRLKLEVDKELLRSNIELIKSQDKWKNTKKVFIEREQKLTNEIGEGDTKIISDILDRYIEDKALLINQLIDNQLTNEEAGLVKRMIDGSKEDKKIYDDFIKLKTLIVETYVTKIRKPMPDKTKKLLESYQKKTSFKLFGIIGLAPLAAFGWLGTLSLGSLQLIGYMAVTQAPQVVFRGSDLEDNLNFEILNIGDDNCITFSYSLPDTDAKTTQTKCLVSD